MCTDQDLGFALLQRWKASGQVVTRADRSWNSRITAYRVRQHQHTAEDGFFVVDRLAVDPSRRITVKDAPTGGPNLKIERGAFRLAAGRRLRWWLVPAPLTLRSIRRGITFGAATQPTAYDDTPTLFVARDGIFNLGHCLADIVNAYLVQQMIPYRRIVFLDDSEDGPFLPLWQALGETEHFRQLRSPRIIERAIFAPPGGCCFLWKNAWQRRPECQIQSALLQAFRADMLQRLGLRKPVRSRPLVTLVSRRHRDDRGNLATRQIVNQDQLLAALQRCDAEIRTVDFARLSCEEQVRAALASDILIGAHGSGLSHLLWLQRPAGVVEIFPAPWQCIYENFAAWSGLDYAAWTKPTAAAEGIHTPSFEVDSEAILHLVRDMLSRLTN